MGNDVQKENGFTPIANNLLEAIYRANITRNEMKVLFCVIRHTYGYNKKEHQMSLSFIANDTGLPKQRVHEAITGLNVKNLLYVNPATGRIPQMLSIQKHFERWEKVTESVTQKEVPTVTENVTDGNGIRDHNGNGIRDQGKTNNKYKEVNTESGANAHSDSDSEKKPKRSRGKTAKLFLNDAKELCRQFTANEELQSCIIEFFLMRKDCIDKPMTLNAFNRMLARLTKLGKDDNERIAILNQSIDHCWQDLYAVKDGYCFDGIEDANDYDEGGERKRQ